MSLEILYFNHSNDGVVERNKVNGFGKPLPLGSKGPENDAKISEVVDR